MTQRGAGTLMERDGRRMVVLGAVDPPLTLTQSTGVNGRLGMLGGAGHHHSGA